ncbi:MAG: hypothetical protein HKN23_05195, partial [Verrucomicrobiales bacterium]|nr:hypothetical protein [Verrucomicrobiales bacterium]
MKLILPALRLVYALLIPFAAFTILELWGLDIGGWWAMGIACGLFVYHFLQWALFETDRLEIRYGAKGADWPFVFLALSILMVGVIVRGDWLVWIVEQFLLEVVAFSAGLALLAIAKAAKEGKEAPWFLVILVFVAPPAAMIWKILPFWMGRHGGDPWWMWVLFWGAFLSGVLGIFLKMKPFAMGDKMLMEPLSSGWKTILAGVWLILLLVAAGVMTA